MTRKADLIEWAPILHGYGFTSRQAGQALGCDARHYCRILRDLGLVAIPARDYAEAMARLTNEERAQLRQVRSAD